MILKIIKIITTQKLLKKKKNKFSNMYYMLCIMYLYVMIDYKPYLQKLLAILRLVQQQLLLLLNLYISKNNNFQKLWR